MENERPSSAPYTEAFLEESRASAPYVALPASRPPQNSMLDLSYVADAHSVPTEIQRLSERRRSSRIDTTFNVVLQFNDLSWTGTAKNIGFGGIYFIVEGIIPIVLTQRVILNFESGASVLSIKGTVCGVRETWRSKPEFSDKTSVGIAAEFIALQHTDAQVLASLIDGVRERSTSIRLTVKLVSLDTGDLLFETSRHTSSGLAKLYPCLPTMTTNSITERRLAPRVSMAVSARICSDESDTGVLVYGVTTNVGLHGVSLKLQSSDELQGKHCVVRLWRSVPATGGQFSRPSAFSTCRVMGQIVWTNEEKQSAWGAAHSNGSHMMEAGICFTPRDATERREVIEFVRPFLDGSVCTDDSGEETLVKSEWKQCWSPPAGKLSFFYDHLRAAPAPTAPVVILAPAYGETKRDYVALSYYLTCNGFHVLRFDYTNHVGESDGEMERFRLSGMQRDLCVMIDYASRNWPFSPISLVATSLSGRVALKALRNRHKISNLILINAIVDVQETLVSVHKEDYIGEYLMGKNRDGYVNVLGFNIEADPWLQDTREAGYADLNSTLKDVTELNVPVIMFISQQDAWVSRESVARVQSSLDNNLKHTYYIPEALHRLSENPRKARAVYSQIVAHLSKETSRMSSQAHVIVPSHREIRKQARLERERARTRHQMPKSENFEFWKEYLKHFHYVVNVPDFWRLLDHIYGMLGTLTGEELILDAGCGNGTFGYYFMANQIYRKRIASANGFKSPRYIGLDFVPTALREAGRSLMHLRRSQTDEFTVGTSAMACEYLCQADLNVSLPFQNNLFDRIVCNLVIGYVDDPLQTIREFVRLLTPGGRLILTNLKPHSDLTQIYRNFFNIARHQEEIREAQELLNNAGKIKQGEENGIFHFFDEQELARLLVSAGTATPRIYSTLSNQAYLAVAEKPQIRYYI